MKLFQIFSVNWKAALLMARNTAHLNLSLARTCYIHRKMQHGDQYIARYNANTFSCDLNVVCVFLYCSVLASGGHCSRRNYNMLFSLSKSARMAWVATEYTLNIKEDCRFFQYSPPKHHFEG